jgi:hypothetical protein
VIVRLLRRAGRAALTALIAMAVASAFFAGGCGLRREREPAAARPAATFVSTATGFRFTPPPAWEADRYLVTEVNNPSRSAPSDIPPAARGALSIADVQFQPRDLGHRPESLLRIYVFGDSAWESAQRAPGSPLGSIVARARGRTYLAATPSGNPYPGGNEDAATFEAMRLALADVKRWLSVADAASDLASEFLPGGPTFGPAPVMYLGGLPAAGGPERRIKVIFRADSSALLSTEFPGRGVVNERGRWGLEGAYLRLQLIDDGGQPKQDPFIWAIRDSALAPVAWDRDFYGSAGLSLALRP